MSEADEVIADVVQEMPQVQTHVVEAAQEETKQASSKTELDHFGVPHDPSIHSTPPKLKADGTWRRKRGSAKQPSLSMPGTSPGEVSAKVGHQIAESIFAIGQLIGGEEWSPQKNVEYGVDERQQMREAWANYAEAKELQDFPAGVALSIVMFGYVFPRLMQPKTKSRIGAAKEWVAAKVLAFRAWRRGEKIIEDDKE